MAGSTPLTRDQERVLQAVVRLEAGEDTATIRRVADETDLDPHRAEAILGELATTHDMIREVRTELDDEATGTGRQYVVKGGPAPRA